MTNIRLASILFVAGALMALGAGSATAQTAAPTVTPPPVRAPQGAPAVVPKVRPTPPAPVAAATPGVRRAPVMPQALRAAPRANTTPPESLPKTSAPVLTPPANAVAQCADGAFIVAPNSPAACSSHRGVRVLMPNRPAPPPAHAAVPAAAMSAAVVASAAPPAGATMQCKDGTYLSGAPSSGRCSANGGLAAVMPAQRAAPPAPRPRTP